MDKVLLVVLFLIDGQLQLVDGWHPIVQPDLDTCEQRKQKVELYLEETTNYNFVSFCLQYGVLPQ